MGVQFAKKVAINIINLYNEDSNKISICLLFGGIRQILLINETILSFKYFNLKNLVQLRICLDFYSDLILKI